MFEASQTQHSVVSGYIQIVSGDSTLPAFWAHPVLGGPFPGVILLHDFWGMTAHLRHQARRLAEQGSYVVAPDFINRQMAALDHSQAVADQIRTAALAHIQTALEALKTHHKCNSKMGLVGWGMGGQFALRTAVTRRDLRAVVLFYGPCDVCTPDELRGLSCPVLAVFAGQDPSNPPEAIAAMREALSGSPAHQVIVFPDMQRGFFDDTHPAFNAAAAETAWTRSLSFLNEHLELLPGTSVPDDR